MSDFTVSKHINGKDWNGNAEMLSLNLEEIRHWQYSARRKKDVLNKTLGKAQEAADKAGRTMTVDVYTGSGRLQDVKEVEPSR